MILSRNMISRFYIWSSLLILFFTQYACTSQKDGGPKSKTDTSELVQQANNTFAPVPEQVANPDNELNEAKIELGKKLFYDTRLSRSNTISCNSCHNMATYGVDNNPTSIGHGWQLGPRNSPTVLNAALHTSQFWDGRAEDVEDQATGPILNPIEMGGEDQTHRDLAVNRIASIDEYVQAFKKAFPDTNNTITLSTIANAIGAFERTLTTPSPFDQFLRGDVDALTAKQKSGLQIFMDAGCTTCHNGAAVGGAMFQKFGLVKGPYWEYTGSETRDTGRAEVTGNESDRYFFKVPSLRNIEHTYPYFHDGSVWSLKKSVQIMGVTQLDLELSEKETEDIVAFLKSLTGEVPENARTLPLLPASQPGTPKPDNSVFRNIGNE